MTQNPTIKLPRERVEQLKALSDKWKLSVADVVAKMINQQIEAGEIEREIPGVQIEKQGKRFRLDMLNDWDKTTQKVGDRLREDRLMLAKELRQLATSLRESFDLPKGEDLLPTPQGLKLARRGSYLKLVDTVTGAEKSLSPSVARDIADVIDEKVDEAS